MSVPFDDKGKTTLEIGIISDTHLPYRMARLPDRVLHVFQGVDLILHAGDVDRFECLRELTALAPVYAVRGNVHFADRSDGGRELPVDLRMTLAGCRVAVTHGCWPNLAVKGVDWFVEVVLRPGGERVNRRIARRLTQQYPDAQVIIFGHTHRPYHAWEGGTLLFNPGGVCPNRYVRSSVGKLFLTPNHIEAKVIVLDE
jgi:putative phosphoesterase